MTADGLAFRPPRTRTVRWRPVGGEGLEHLTITPDDTEIVARGVIIGERGALPYGVDYTLVLDPFWRIREFDLATTAGMALSLRSDGEGRWTNHDGRPVPEFDGCLDVDLSGSAFTNTLPIRRVDWSVGAPRALAVLYVPFDTFVPIHDRQLYTCLEAGRLFRYEAEDRSFAADLPVDRDGLVLDYPTLFQRA